MRRKESQRFELVLDPQRIAWIPKGGAGWPALGHRFSCSRSSRSSASGIEPEPGHEDIQLNARQDGLDDGSKAARRSTEQARSFLFSDGRRRQRRRKLQEASIKVEWARHLVLGHRDKNAIARIYDRPHAH